MPELEVRRGVYPCCAGDVSEPRQLLVGLVDELIFCDPCTYPEWSKVKHDPELPAPVFVTKDFRLFVAELPPVSVLFYRQDSAGEGGSGLWILSKKWMKQILKAFPDEGGLIITDGSNSGSHLFRKMTKPTGYTSISLGFSSSLSPDQHPWRENNLVAISATRTPSA